MKAQFSGKFGQQIVSFQVIEPLNTLMDTFDTHIYTKDWHPEDHISFYDNVCQRDLDETSPITNCSEANLFDTVSTNDKKLLLWT